MFLALAGGSVKSFLILLVTSLSVSSWADKRDLTVAGASQIQFARNCLNYSIQKLESSVFFVKKTSAISQVIEWTKIDLSKDTVSYLYNYGSGNVTVVFDFDVYTEAQDLVISIEPHQRFWKTTLKKFSRAYGSVILEPMKCESNRAVIWTTY